MKIPTAIALIVFTAICKPLLSAQDPQGQHWQQQRLLSPTAEEYLAEQKGRVVIYDGLHETVVDRALDIQFGRMGAMMFVQVQHTDPDGEVWADDDCD